MGSSRIKVVYSSSDIEIWSRYEIPRTNHKSLPVRFESTYLLTSLFVNLPPRYFFESKLHSKRSLDLATQPGFHLLDLFHRDDPTPHLGQRSSSQPVSIKLNQKRTGPNQSHGAHPPKKRGFLNVPPFS